MALSITISIAEIRDSVSIFTKCVTFLFMSISVDFRNAEDAKDATCSCTKLERSSRRNLGVKISGLTLAIINRRFKSEAV
jgi:hypothetical protein